MASRSWWICTTFSSILPTSWLCFRRRCLVYARHRSVSIRSLSCEEMYAKFHSVNPSQELTYTVVYRSIILYYWLVCLQHPFSFTWGTWIFSNSLLISLTRSSKPDRLPFRADGGKRQLFLKARSTCNGNCSTILCIFKVCMEDCRKLWLFSGELYNSYDYAMLVVVMVNRVDTHFPS